MKKQEFQFLEKNILNLIKNDKAVKVDVILDCLDYFNKVRYSIEDINPILDKLILEKRIAVKGDTYTIIR